MFTSLCATVAPLLGLRSRSLANLYYGLRNDDPAAWTTVILLTAVVFCWNTIRRTQEDRMAPDGGE